MPAPSSHSAECTAPVLGNRTRDLERDAVDEAVGEAVRVVAVEQLLKWLGVAEEIAERDAATRACVRAMPNAASAVSRVSLPRTRTRLAKSSASPARSPSATNGSSIDSGGHERSMSGHGVASYTRWFLVVPRGQLISSDRVRERRGRWSGRLAAWSARRPSRYARESSRRDRELSARRAAPRTTR